MSGGPTGNRDRAWRRAKGLPLWHPAVAVASWFGSGFLPFAPGSWGSAAALPVAWAVAVLWHPLGLVPAALFLFVLGWWAADVAVTRSGEDDPGFIVVDEVAGQWLTLAVVPADPLLYGIGFVLFRLVDVVKPGLVGWAERAAGGAFAVMIDDVVAALHAAPVLYLIAWMMGATG